ncbi:ABC transporter permease [Enterococcus sp.]|uniref:ABC transporter permease n=1 Tax=Enterococcus sp. TaxID=35783 RepID=UPI0025BA269D|nr:ABC transporter permease [Enterococcus sp.]
MFGHLYLYRLKVLIRNKSLLFWTLIFPVLLGLMFSIAFSEIDQSGKIETIPVGIVSEPLQDTNDEQLAKQAAFVDVLKQIKSGEAPLFSIQEISKQEAEQRLEEGDIAGYYTFDPSSIQLAIASTGLSQTILKNVMDGFLQTNEKINELMAIEAPLTEKQLSALSVGSAFVKEENQNQNMSIKSFYFFTLVAMAILYGFMWGIRNAQDQQANQSSKGIRLSVIPQKKLLVFSANILAGFTVFFTEVLLILSIFHFVYQVDFGQRWQWILLVAALGTLNALLLGNLVGNLLPSMGLAQKEGLGIAVTMTMSFFAGMMGSQEIKYWIDLHVPLLAKLNLVNLISESFYQLYYYRSLEDFYGNLLWLTAFILMISFSNLLFERRVQYVAV